MARGGANSWTVAPATPRRYDPNVDERPWQDEMIELLRAELDVTLIEARLRLTPTQRLEALRAQQSLIDEFRRARGDRLPRND